MYKSENLDKWFTILEGLRQYDPQEPESSYPVATGKRVRYYFENAPNCAFGNIGNLLCNIIEESAGYEFIKNLNTDVTKFLSVKEYSRLSIKHQHSRYHIAVILLSRGGFSLIKMEQDTDILTVDLNVKACEGLFMIPN